jgi:hypothetical protein
MVDKLEVNGVQADHLETHLEITLSYSNNVLLASSNILLSRSHYILHEACLVLRAQ